MKIKLTNADAMNLFQTLTNMNISGNAEFTLAIARNRSLLKTHIDALQEVAGSYIKLHPELKDYQEKLDKLLKQFAVDTDGKPLTRQSPDGTGLARVIPPENQGVYVVEREKLDYEYHVVLVGMTKHQEDFASLLRKEEEFEFRTISKKDLPEGQLNTQIMNTIFIFVEDDN